MENVIDLKRRIGRRLQTLRKQHHLSQEVVAKVLGVSPSSGYELMHEKDFPTLKIGNRIVVPKEQFISWVNQNTGGAD